VICDHRYDDVGSGGRGQAKGSRSKIEDRQHCRPHHHRRCHYYDPPERIEPGIAGANLRNFCPSPALSVGLLTSVSGQKRTSKSGSVTSALPPKADILFGGEKCPLCAKIVLRLGLSLRGRCGPSLSQFFPILRSFVGHPPHLGLNCAGLLSKPTLRRAVQRGKGPASVGALFDIRGASRARRLRVTADGLGKPQERRGSL
jgi:hypothetical protein